MHKDWTALYALQDIAMDTLRKAEHEFYLTGGTALGRGYYHHRYSEDLDLFVNDSPDFTLWRDRCIEALHSLCNAGGFRLDIVLREARFGRVFLQGETTLKIEFVNDVPCRIGVASMHPRLGLLDTRENILANKISAIVDRGMPKDLADIYYLCCVDNLSAIQAIEDVSGKAAGIFPPLVAQAFERVLPGAWDAVAWENAPPKEVFEAGVRTLVRQIVDMKG